jgi:hypothetical protein
MIGENRQKVKYFKLLVSSKNFSQDSDDTYAMLHALCSMLPTDLLIYKWTSLFSHFLRRGSIYELPFSMAGFEMINATATKIIIIATPHQGVYNPMLRVT